MCSPQIRLSLRQLRFLKRQLVLPVSTMSQWWVTGAIPFGSGEADMQRSLQAMLRT